MFIGTVIVEELVDFAALLAFRVKMVFNTSGRDVEVNLATKYGGLARQHTLKKRACSRRVKQQELRVLSGLHDHIGSSVAPRAKCTGMLGISWYHFVPFPCPLSPS